MWQGDYHTHSTLDDGKSTLADFLGALSRQEGTTPITVIGMDGFHRYQEDLLSVLRIHRSL